RKATTRDLGLLAARGESGATTVAATMAIAAAAGIRVFATGGIGGVHRGAEETFDVSADLLELSRPRVVVVAAGAKAVLDLPKTLEALETLGVPV
ncbi:MAG TPA: pseudouridine-5'-phosphate glycosidase, partial [Thermoanaerobaculia bacterium]|nr:pseudouridine-5'-phosphate glycosidase [Thermoanaerobaculia bacterium]